MECLSIVFFIFTLHDIGSSTFLLQHKRTTLSTPGAHRKYPVQTFGLYGAACHIPKQEAMPYFNPRLLSLQWWDRIIVLSVTFTKHCPLKDLIHKETCWGFNRKTVLMALLWASNGSARLQPCVCADDRSISGQLGCCPFTRITADTCRETVHCHRVGGSMLYWSCLPLWIDHTNV